MHSYTLARFPPAFYTYALNDALEDEENPTPATDVPRQGLDTSICCPLCFEIYSTVQTLACCRKTICEFCLQRWMFHTQIQTHSSSSSSSFDTSTPPSPSPSPISQHHASCPFCRSFIHKDNTVLHLDSFSEFDVRQYVQVVQQEKKMDVGNWLTLVHRKDLVWNRTSTKTGDDNHEVVINVEDPDDDLVHTSDDTIDRVKLLHHQLKLQHLVDTLLVKCLYTNCSWTGPRNQLRKHLEFECSFTNGVGKDGAITIDITDIQPPCHSSSCTVSTAPVSASLSTQQVSDSPSNDNALNVHDSRNDKRFTWVYWMFWMLVVICCLVLPSILFMLHGWTS